MEPRSQQSSSQLRTSRRSPSHYTATSPFGSATNRFVKDSLIVLNKLKERLPEHIQPYFWLGLWFGSALLIIGLVIGFRSKIVAVLQALADFIKGLGSFGPPVIMICLFATSFPPLVGYSSIVTMSGYVYGFVYGFIYAFTGAMAGSIVCFYFCRRWFKGQVRKLMAQNKTLKSVVRTVEKRGFRLLVLIRLAPYPFNVMNAILSATHIPLTTFITATAISLVKLTLHVYIGSTLSTLTEDDDEDETDPNKDRKAHGKRLKIAMMVMGVILGIGVGLYVWAVAKREIAITEAARLERHRQRRRANGGNRSQSSYDHDRIGGAGGNGIELNEQQGYIPDVDLTSRDSIDGFFSGAGNERSGGRGQDLSDARYFVGGAGSRDHYQEDYEDDGDHEGNSLFGTNRVWHQQQQQQQEQSWRNVGAGDNNIEYSDSDPSDYSDDSDFERDDDDLERGLELSLGRDRDGVEEEEEEEALDFSAHHDEFVESPWHDEENNDSNFLLEDEELTRVPSGQSHSGGTGSHTSINDGWRH